RTRSGRGRGTGCRYRGERWLRARAASERSALARSARRARTRTARSQRPRSPRSRSRSRRSTASDRAGSAAAVRSRPWERLAVRDVVVDAEVLPRRLIGELAQRVRAGAGGEVPDLVVAPGELADDGGAAGAALQAELDLD